MTEYTFIYGDVSDFDRELQEHLKEGWLPFMNMNTTHVPGEGLHFSIMLSKYTPNEQG